MDYKQTIDYLFEKLPMYQRVGDSAFKKDLTNIIAFCKHLKNPQLKFKSVHIAGTNGKGSVSHLLTSALMESGLKVGLYTSPHLLDFRERIKINGKDVTQDFVVRFVKENKKIIEKVQPSFFEITVAMAFDYFAKQNVDIAVIETGLGGRLDSTNILNPLVSVITNISLEHEKMLGNTIEKIAVEKAGIIKKEIPVVIGEKKLSTEKVFQKIAEERKSPIYFVSDEYQFDFKGIENIFSVFNIFRNEKIIFDKLKCDLLGSYQGENINTVLKVLDIISDELKSEFNSMNLRKAFRQSIKNTNIHGRWELMEENPTVIFDISHNAVAVKNMLMQVNNYKFNNLHIVFGMSNDKSFENIFKLLPIEANYYFAKPNVPRGLDANKLKEIASKFDLKGKVFKTVKHALSTAKNNAVENDMILVTGSAFVVADAMSF